MFLAFIHCLSIQFYKVQFHRFESHIGFFSFWLIGLNLSQLLFANHSTFKKMENQPI